MRLNEQLGTILARIALPRFIALTRFHRYLYRCSNKCVVLLVSLSGKGESKLSASLVNRTWPVWFGNVQTRSPALTRLFCFPYAGASSVVYHNWLSSLPEGLDVFPIQLPGRGMRLNTPPYTSLEELVGELAPALKDYFDRPFFFFGHSMGAVIAFELARAVKSEFQQEPEMLFVSGRNAPSVPWRNTEIHALPRGEFIAELKQLNGTHPDLLESEELLDLVLPILRADFELVEAYRFQPGPTLTCPIKALGGAEDRGVDRAALTAWGKFTSGEFSTQVFPGDHFFIHSQKDALLESISRDIRKSLSQYRSKTG